jgi:hypothetical protein
MIEELKKRIEYYNTLYEILDDTYLKLCQYTKDQGNKFEPSAKFYSCVAAIQSCKEECANEVIDAGNKIVGERNEA